MCGYIISFMGSLVYVQMSAEDLQTCGNLWLSMFRVILMFTKGIPGHLRFD